jgi:hypothetical protein
MKLVLLFPPRVDLGASSTPLETVRDTRKKRANVRSAVIEKVQFGFFLLFV